VTRPVAAVAASAVLLLGSCGGDDDDAGATTTTSSTAPVATTTTEAPVSTYTVQAGDTLFDIANRFGTTVAAIVEANGLTDPDRLSIGQVLELPTTTSTSTP